MDANIVAYSATSISIVGRLIFMYLFYYIVKNLQIYIH